MNQQLIASHIATFIFKVDACSVKNDISMLLLLVKQSAHLFDV